MAKRLFDISLYAMCSGAFVFLAAIIWECVTNNFDSDASVAFDFIGAGIFFVGFLLMFRVLANGYDPYKDEIRK